MPDTTTFAVLTGLGLTPSEGNDYQYVSKLVFNEGSQKDVNIFVNTQTGELINTQDNKSKAFNTAEVEYEYWSLNENTTSAASRLLNGITEYGSEFEVDGSILTIMMPEEQRKVEAYIGSTSTSTTTTGGAEYAGVAAGETKGNVTVTAVNCGAGSSSAVEIVPVSNLVKTAKGSGKSIIVGGWVANAAAANLEVNAGNTLEKLLINSGDYVAAVLASGDIVVAGFNGNDTGRAAQDLITALEGLM
jgi:hypothetical protein